MRNCGPFTNSDLPIHNGKIYHLDITPEEMAKEILIVGDPDRVPQIADEFFSEIDVDRFHRGLRTITGFVKKTNHRVSIVTSGMGTPSLEIVLNEIVALNEINFRTKKRKDNSDKINIIRVGTSGILQPNTKLGTLIITEYAVGLDNTGMFYNIPYSDEVCQTLEREIQIAIDKVISNDSRFIGKIFPYASKANKEVIDALVSSAKEFGVRYKKGVTLTSSGFYANQGRDISDIPITIPDIDELLAGVKFGMKKLLVENMEMEISFLLHFFGALGYKSGALCVGIANRREDTFAENYLKNIKDATNIALNALYKLKQN